MKLSDKKQQELYNVIHEEIMKVRVKLCTISDKELVNSVNDIMADLCYKAPEAALNVFKAKNKTKN